MENLTNQELQDLATRYRANLNRLMISERDATDNTRPQLYREMEAITNSLNNTRAEATRRGIELI